MDFAELEEPGQGMNSAPARVRPFWEVELGHSSFSKFQKMAVPAFIAFYRFFSISVRAL